MSTLLITGICGASMLAAMLVKLPRNINVGDLFASVVVFKLNALLA